jgi:hypothetical protein
LKAFGFRNDLKLKPDKIQRVHDLTEPSKVKIIQKCKQLLNWHAGNSIIFPDKKMFQLQESHNQPNDRKYAVQLADIPWKN